MKAMTLRNFSAFDDGNLERFIAREQEAIEADIVARPCNSDGKTKKRKLTIEIEYEPVITVDSGRFRIKHIEVRGKVKPANLPGYQTNAVPARMTEEGLKFNDDTNNPDLLGHPDQKLLGNE